MLPPGYQVNSGGGAGLREAVVRESSERLAPVLMLAPRALCKLGWGGTRAAKGPQPRAGPDYLRQPQPGRLAHSPSRSRFASRLTTPR